MSDSTPSPHPIWQALLSPNRAVEVRAWLTRSENATQALSWRGPRGESMLHWGAMADMGLMIDLIGLGIDVNAKDGDGRTPADWLCERVWMTHMEGVGNLTKLNLRKLRVMTDDLLSTLWRQGGRSTMDLSQLGQMTVQLGLWEVLGTIRDMEGEGFLGDWPVGSPLHVWHLAPAEQGREDFLKSWVASGKGVDPVDGKGQTPLFVAVQHRLDSGLSARQALDVDAAIDALLAHGADPNAESVDGQTPLSLPLLCEAPSSVVEHVVGRLEVRVKSEGGLVL